ncbi:endolytic transglycosylase MltG [Phreatobacter sp. AB_2022a]|uniref:endolytic transglycosylase MltG n=1 Tax=Phreatobacter sp. AB_2022a TaxID=3003134 RepID=UPI00228737C7|nr:endolytic transglycosylase MltG [Phreatobacter sp. AB_2022a]MCZ0734051.1 endolytic transglycosylase MltG [Phreatobacter sp. AB_2022a]
MNDSPGLGPVQNGSRPAIKSPRAALEPEAPPPAPPASRHVRNQWVVLGNLILTIALVVLVGGLVGFSYARHAFVSPGPLEQDRAVFIPRGSTSDQIGDTLERNGVISSSLLFVGAVQLYGARGDLKWGEYLFPKRVSMAEAMAIIIEGKAIEYRITIPEGLTSEQIVGRLRDNDILVGDIARIPREGSLMPDTYKFTRGTSRQQIIDQMAALQARAVQTIWARRQQDLPIRSIEEMVILASIVEKETGRADERPRVAGVFVNRLNRRMRLQSDPTIVYGLVGGRGTLGRGIQQAEIQRLTPYNTYQIDGLPPTPIANPGRAAMEAVVNPVRSRDIYFVADGTGGHVFAETLEQHNRNVANWRRIERERGQPDQVRDRPIADPAAATATPGAASPATTPR